MQHSVWVDVGGTFTDCLLVSDGLRKGRCKVLSSGEIRIGELIPTASGGVFSDSKTELLCECEQIDQAAFWQSHAELILTTPFQQNPIRLSKFEWSIAGGIVRITPKNTDAFDKVNLSSFTATLIPGLPSPVIGIRQLLNLSPPQPIPPIQLRLGTTRGTNALLERNGAAVAFVTTEGFADLVEIGTQQRDDLFALHIEKRQPLYKVVETVPERLDADGIVIQDLDETVTRERLAKIREQGIESLAICLVHSYKNRDHEIRVAKIASELGFKNISVSSKLSTLAGAVYRAETAIVDAYLNPVIENYVGEIRSQLNDSSASLFHVMTSAGNLVPTGEFRGKDSVLSGPAGGVVALASLAQKENRLAIGFDMGGTSTDVCRYEEQIRLSEQNEKASVRLMTPMVDIHTVAAGGGSVCWFDGVQLRVGPASAGANPGPACYGNGGPLTITDVNLILGRVSKTHFQFPLDETASLRRLEEIAEQMKSSNVAVDSKEPILKLAEGFRQIAGASMAAAIRNITVAEGCDPRDHVLVGFGGAAGQHACELADELGIDTTIDHPDAGLFSAVGMGMARIARSKTAGVYRTMTEIELSSLHVQLAAMKTELAQHVISEGQLESDLDASFVFQIRYESSSSTIDIRAEGSDCESCELLRNLKEKFERTHDERFGYRQKRPIELASVRCTVESRGGNRGGMGENWSIEREPACDLPLEKTHKIFFRGRLLNCPIIHRQNLAIGKVIFGPCLIVSDGHTTVVDDGWQSELQADGTLVCSATTGSQNRTSFSLGQNDLVSSSVDPVFREVLAQRLATIADQMGAVLQQTAASVNIRERRDFSCAVFDSQGNLVANAPHVPVHLGAMGETVQQIIADFPRMHRGDSFVTNDPYRGGSHLPDVTVVTPVFDAATGQRQFFVASRAHHAEIGGIAPGSMTPEGKCLGDEGVVLSSRYLTCQNVDCRQELLATLRSGRYPSRDPDLNLQEIDAQQAANRHGQHQLQALVDEFGFPRIAKYVEHILRAAELKTQLWIEQLAADNPDKTFRFADQLDDGSVISVQLTPITGENHASRLAVDFSGTSPTHQGNFNANRGIVTAAVLYSVRCHLEDSLPMNSGVMRCIDFVIPSGLLDPPRKKPVEQSPAVAAGNVETSQRLVDCVLGALGNVAASQGTMNNFLFGNESFGYYETICGGAGASWRGEGASAVQVHMTNTYLTDIEILESRHPVRLSRFEIRRGSGGQGKYRGGDGVIRRVTALEPLTVSLITSRRVVPPYGVAGGTPGQCGENYLLRSDGSVESLPSVAQLEINPGESIEIHTPGGGGFGK